MSTNVLPERKELDPALQWRLEDIYPTPALWEEDFQKAKAALPALSAFAGKLGQDGPTLAKALDTLMEGRLLVERLYVYAHMRRDENNADAGAQALSDRAAMLATESEAAAAFFTPEILALPEGRVEGFLQDCPALETYGYYLSQIQRMRPHTLSQEGEQLLAMAGDMGQGADTIYSMLAMADLTFPTVQDENGQDVELTHGRFIPLMESRDRSVRMAAFEALYHTYRKYRNTIAATLSTSVKKDIFFARARHYESSLAASLDPDNVPPAVYDSLVTAVRGALPELHRLVEIKKRALGLDAMHMYDLYTPLVDPPDMAISYEKAKALAVEGLAPLGPAYIDVMGRGLERDGWVDVHENRGKTSGAYSWGVWGVHPYVLLNWHDTVDQLFTLAHELGHAMHSYLSDKSQPYVNAQYPLILAEVASTCNEAILMDFMLARTTDRDQRRYLVHYFLEQFRTTVFRQVMFAEFEKATHAMAEAGEALTPDALSAVYRQLNIDYYGPAMVVDDEIALEWARIPHFYRAFYVYKYATGFASAIALSRRVLSGEQGRAQYLNFLSSGGSDDPLALLQAAGVDLTQPHTVAEALRTFGELVDEMDRLMI